MKLIKGNIYLWRGRVYVEYIGWGDGNSDIRLFRSINGGLIRIPDNKVSNEITSDPENLTK